MKNLANVITSSRIVSAVAMVLAEPFSTVFWMCYVCGGLSDLLDGFTARALNQQSAAGAKLDSLADLVFASSILVVAVKYMTFPIWLWIYVMLIALLRFISYSIGFCKYRTFSSLHTYMNKTTGALLFAFPLLCALIGLYAAEILICFAAFVSSVEELAITVKSKELNRDCKGIFMK